MYVYVLRFDALVDVTLNDVNLYLLLFFQAVSSWKQVLFFF